MDEIVTASVDNPAWGEAPINPAWIIAGAPRARAVTLAQSADRFSLTATWECTAGAFRWHYDSDETVHVLEGGMTVTDSRGRSSTLGPGDVALFRAGTVITWDVPEYVRKLAFFHRPVPRGLGLPIKVIGRLNRVRARRIRLMR